MHAGGERDGLFIDHNEVHAYEFTTSRAKDKATYDASKVLDLLKAIGAQSEHSFKSRSGWLVTLDEPTADQRAAVQAVTRKASERIHIIASTPSINESSTLNSIFKPARIPLSGERV